jgi:hypothetical protein
MEPRFEHFMQNKIARRVLAMDCGDSSSGLRFLSLAERDGPLNAAAAEAHGQGGFSTIDFPEVTCPLPSPRCADGGFMQVPDG